VHYALGAVGLGRQLREAAARNAACDESDAPAPDH
jgi:hypothetical protein